MESLWPWMAIAGVGALHGLNPASGWLWAAAWGVRSGERGRAWRALVPIALGHTASVAWVATAVAVGVSMDRTLLLTLAGGLLVVAALVHLSGHAPKRAQAPVGHIGLALWSFMVSTAHGAGLMLVPALMPLCLGAGPDAGIGASGLVLALAAVAVHTAAMLVVTGVVASGVCRGVDTGAQWLGRFGRAATPR
jgi:hypothetical protein